MLKRLQTCHVRKLKIIKIKAKPSMHVNATLVNIFPCWYVIYHVLDNKITRKSPLKIYARAWRISFAFTIKNVCTTTTTISGRL